MKNFFRGISIAVITVLLLSCDNISEKQALNKPQPLSEEFKEYWYGGEAEITSYELQQARYGEMREGTAVLIFVTEDFLLKEHVKTDNREKKSKSVLKLNATKTFNTGIYPYSVMESTFYPVENNRHPLKVTGSVQEWCGHTWFQLNNRDGFEVNSFSYFEENRDSREKLSYSFIENEFWTQLRINPASLPTGKIVVVPSPQYLRFSHVKIRGYKAIAELTETDSLNIYKLQYPDLRRTLKIWFHPEPPYEIEAWEDSYPESQQEDAEILTSRATKMERIKSAYWEKNSNKDLSLRKKLQLD